MTGKVLQERIAAVSNIPFNTIAESPAVQCFPLLPNVQKRE